MRKLALMVVFSMALIPLNFSATAPALAKGGGLLPHILRYADDVARLGKQTAKVSKQQLDDLVKRLPALSGKSQDLIKGTWAIEKVTQKSSSAAKLVEKGVNPAKVALTAERTPTAVKLGDDIAALLGAAKAPATLTGLPPKALQAARTLEGNYAKAGNSFFEMARRGGRGAVEVAQKLYELATPGTVTAAAATALLAWHMADPEGAEETITKFLHEHVGGVGKAIGEGVMKGGGEALDGSLDAASEGLAKLASRHWGWILVGFLVLPFVFSPKMRTLPRELLDAFAGKLLSRLPNATPPRGEGRERTEHFNIYNRRG